MNTKNNIFFSMITPTYNRAHTLTALFDSLKDQTFKDFEWVIADDGSTDSTEELVKSFCELAKFPIVYHQIEHGGKAKAFVYYLYFRNKN